MEPVSDSSAAPHVVDRARIEPRDDGPKQQFWAPVWLLLMSDGTVRWTMDDD